MTKTIVVPLDETELAERALPVGASLAAAAGAELELLVVDAAGPRALEEDAYLTTMREQLPVELQVRQVAVHRDAPVAEIVVSEAVGRPEPVIVMATHGRTAIGELVLGSVADAVIRRSPVPVVLVGPRCAPAPIAGDGPILVALDGSPGDAGVIETAARFGLELGGPVVAVHVRVPVAVDGGVVLEGGDEVAVHAAVQLRALGVPAAELTVEALYPAEELVRTAAHRSARAIVVGTHRPSRLERAVLGSTAMAVVRRSTCPTVVVGAPLAEE